MSEAITKACETCAGVGRPMTFWNGIVDCVDCSGTGRVPDDEAMLRAEVGRLTAEVERLKAMTIEAVKGTSLTIIDAIGGTAQQTIEGRADPEFAEVALRAQLGAARAEVARLTAGDLNAYQAAAATTAMTGSRGNLPYLALGLNGEAGEVAEDPEAIAREVLAMSASGMVYHVAAAGPALARAYLDLRAELDKRTSQLAESEERRVTARHESDAASERLHAVTAHRAALFTALQRYERDGNLPSFCPCCGGEMLCDGCDDDCALNAARAAVMAEQKERRDAVR